VEIAARLGYQDQFHFSRQFKAFQGLSPTEYRENGAVQPARA
jgi:AraC-like DNA-binding protein